MKPSLFLGFVAEYKGSFTIDIKKKDGTTALSSYSLAASTYARTETVYFADPISDTDLSWELSGYDAAADILYNIQFITQDLKANEPKLFLYCTVRHSGAATVVVRNEAGTSKGTYVLPANPTNQTTFALNAPFLGHYAFLTTTSGTTNLIQAYEFTTAQPSVDIKMFTGAVVEYYGGGDDDTTENKIKFKKTDGNYVEDTQTTPAEIEVELTETGNAMKVINFPEPIFDTDLVWEISTDTDNDDLVKKVTFKSVTLPQMTQDMTKHLFTHLEVEHTAAIDDITVYDSNFDATGNYLTTKALEANSTGKTLLALQNPFVDYFGYVVQNGKTGEGDISSFRLLKADEVGA